MLQSDCGLFSSQKAAGRGLFAFLPRRGDTLPPDGGLRLTPPPALPTPEQPGQPLPVPDWRPTADPAPAQQKGPGGVGRNADDADRGLSDRTAMGDDYTLARQDPDTGAVPDNEAPTVDGVPVGDGVTTGAPAPVFPTPEQPGAPLPVPGLEPGSVDASPHHCESDGQASAPQPRRQADNGAPQAPGGRDLDAMPWIPDDEGLPTASPQRSDQPGLTGRAPADEAEQAQRRRQRAVDGTPKGAHANTAAPGATPTRRTPTLRPVRALWRRVGTALALLALCGGLVGCRSKGRSPQDSSGANIPAQSNSLGASMDESMDNSISGSLSGGSSGTGSGSSDTSDSAFSTSSGASSGVGDGTAEDDMAAGSGGSSGIADDATSGAGPGTPGTNSGTSDTSGATSAPDSDTTGSDADASRPAAANAPAVPQTGTAARAVTVDPAADWPLTLVNATHLLREDYAPTLQQVAGSEKQLETHAAQALEKLFAAAEAEGLPCHLVSGYRSISYQKGLFARKVQSYLDEGLPQAEAEAAAAQWVARPGSSEHSLGLAADIVSGDWYLSHDDLTEDFAQTPQFTWLQQHAAEYGFILRYPQDKEAVTGVHYEPWHYRYVGEAAPDITASGLTLEEYLAAQD